MCLELGFDNDFYYGFNALLSLITAIDQPIGGIKA